MTASAIKNAAAGAIWAYSVWILLTWTATLEQLVFGAGVAIAIGCALAPLGGVMAPWRLFSPRRLAALVGLVVDSGRRIIVANLALARRIWGPRSRLRTGMLVVPSEARGDAEVAAVGLVTSLIVDNQIVDLDRSAHRLQYHAIDVPPGGDDQRYERINGPTERRIVKIVRGR